MGGGVVKHSLQRRSSWGDSWKTRRKLCFLLCSLEGNTCEAVSFLGLSFWNALDSVFQCSPWTTGIAFTWELSKQANIGLQSHPTESALPQDSQVIFTFVNIGEVTAKNLITLDEMCHWRFLNKVNDPVCQVRLQWKDGYQWGWLFWHHDLELIRILRK